jgi:hypothetical protein
MIYYNKKPTIELLFGDKDDLFVLKKNIVYNWREKILVVPKGFKSDGCSVPRFLWSTISPQIDPRTLAGAILHDYIYRNAYNLSWTRKEADKAFYDIIRSDGLSWWKAQKAYWGVRLFGASSWRKEDEN